VSDTTLDPSLDRPDAPPTPLDSTGSLSDDTVATEAVEGFSVDQAICLVPTQTTTAETPAYIADEDSAVFANTASETDTIVRPTAAGETVIESLRGPTAPDSFSWSVGMPEGYELAELSNGSIALLDPAEDAAIVTVPSPPVAAQDPDAIADAETQLQVQEYEITNAEQETGKAVAAVIAEPYTVDAAGNSSPSSLTLTDPDTISVASAPAAEAVVVRLLQNSGRRGAPKSVPAEALGLNGTSQAQITTEAVNAMCDFAARAAPGLRLLLLDFGRASRYPGGGFGTKRQGDRIPNDKILEAMQWAAYEYQPGSFRRCHVNGRMRIVYGLNNSEIEQSVDSTHDARKIGQHQARTAAKLADYQNSQVFFTVGESAGVGGDIETGYGGPNKSIPLAGGAKGAGGGPYYDYGTAGGCAPDPRGCLNNWTLDQLAHVSSGGGGHPLPEIYCRGLHAKQWAHVANRGGNNYAFAGTLWESSGGLSGTESWKAMRRATDKPLGRELINYPGGPPNCSF
jgi:hypothetical protein